MNTNTPNIFDDNQDGNSDDVTLDVLVGEGRKYSDPNALAKAYINAEDFIETLKAENAQLRAKELAPNNPNADPGSPGGDNPGITPPVNGNPKEVDWRATIREELKTLTEEERSQTNLKAASNKMLEIYGTQEEANKAITRRANELGVSVEWMKDSASKSPAAFFATMEVARQQSRSTPSSSGEIRIDTSRGSERNFKYYEDLRKSNRSKYFSVEVQQEMLAQAKTLGSKFYN